MSSATSTSSITELGGKFVLDRECNSVTTNITGGTGSIFMIQINNEANSSTAFLKIRDNVVATPQTTAANGTGTPHFTFMAPPHTKITYAMLVGAAFTQGLSIWCTTGKAVGNQTSPSSAVIVKLITS